MGVLIKKQLEVSRLSAGAYPATLIQVVALGTQTTVFQGVEKTKDTILLVWEVSKEKADGKPFILSQRLTNTLNPKGQLYKVLCSIMRKNLSIDDCEQIAISDLLDSHCLLTVTLESSGNTANIFNKIVAVSPLPEGVKCSPRVNDLIEFGLDDIHDVNLFENLFPWVQECILNSKELQQLKQQ